VTPPCFILEVLLLYKIINPNLFIRHAHKKVHWVTSAAMKRYCKSYGFDPELIDNGEQCTCMNDIADDFELALRSGTRRAIKTGSVEITGPAKLYTLVESKITGIILHKGRLPDCPDQR